MKTTNLKKQVNDWQLCRDIASWLPGQDQKRAIAIIKFHEQQHAAAERRGGPEGAD